MSGTLFDAPTLAAIFGMAAVTYATRIAGFGLAGRFRLEGRAAAAFAAIPPAVLTAVVAPVLVATGPAETLAGLAAALAAFRLPLIAVVGVGVVAVVALRAAGL